MLKDFLRQERGIMDEAKRLLEIRGLPYAKLGRMRGEVAKQREFPPQDEYLPYLIGQLLNMLFHSNNVVEIYAPDHELRKIMVPVLKKYMDVDEEIDREVRAQIKNLQEGTAAFEVEYAKVLEKVKRTKGFE